MHTDLEPSPLITERLRELPAELMPPMSWAEFQHRLAMRRSKPMPASRYAALAAGLATLLAGIAMWSRMSQPNHSPSPAVTQAELPMLALPDPHLIAQARASEHWLARLPAEPAVVRVGTRIAVADLEDRIAWVDDVLSDEGLDAVNPTHIVALRYERARLVNSLAQVRYAESLFAAAE